MTKTLALAGILLVGLSLTGCASGSSEEGNDDGKRDRQDAFSAESIPLPDGRTVTCIVYDDPWTTGTNLSCDWVSIVPSD
jgi:hypothetical protein